MPQVLTPRRSASSSYAVARGLLEAGDYEASLKLLSGLAPPDRHSPEASYWRARCYEKLATAAYLSLFQASPDSYRLHQLMGDLAAAKGNDGKAIEEYRQAIALKPSLPNLHYSLGHLLWKDLKVSEARQELDAELALNPRHAGALNDLGNTYLLEHQPDKALPYLSRALAANLQNLDIHRDLGTAYSELGDYGKAEAEFKIAVSTDRDGSVHYKLARVYQALGQREKAAREFELSTALNAETHTKLEKQRERLDEVEKSTQDP
jgi:tetratricopeptide (TPR) repeat protein